MTENLFKIVFILVGLFIIYKLIFSSKQGPMLFEMHFKDGRLTSHKGKIPEKFQRECRAIAKSEKLTCVVRAENPKQVRLHISANVGEGICQRIRNQFPFEIYDKKTVKDPRRAS